MNTKPTFYAVTDTLEGGLTTGVMTITPVTKPADGYLSEYKLVIQGVSRKERVGRDDHWGPMAVFAADSMLVLVTIKAQL